MSGGIFFFFCKQDLFLFILLADYIRSQTCFCVEALQIDFHMQSSSPYSSSPYLPLHVQKRIVSL